MLVALPLVFALLSGATDPPPVDYRSNNEAASWALVGAFGVSLSYELWRAYGHPHESDWDGMGAFDLAFYSAGFAGSVLMRRDDELGSIVGATISGILLSAAFFYYIPEVMPTRNPGVPDYVEAVLYTGGLAAALYYSSVPLWSEAGSSP